jgi:LAS superfamily LD-carboxypeptidase LdcB
MMNKYKISILPHALIGLLLSQLIAYGSGKSGLIHPQNKNPYSHNHDTDAYITKEFLMGKFNYAQHPRFEKVPKARSNKEIYIQKETLKAFMKMAETAEKEGIHYIILSGTRNYNEQKIIWEKKWKKYIAEYKDTQKTAMKILEYSAMPSTSRHHWGTDIDINSLQSSYFSSGQGQKEYEWLKKNANKFGFYQTYSNTEKERTGYSEEKWHWSYMPLAEKYLLLYNQLISNKDISGFMGCEAAEQIDIIKNFVNGISVAH